MGKFPVEYTGSLSNGITMGGIIPVLINILILSMNVDVQMAGFGCFVFASAMSIACLGTYAYMTKQPFYVHYTYITSQDNGQEWQPGPKNQKLTKEIVKTITGNCWIFALTLLTICVTSQMIYPGAAALIEPIDPDGSDWHEIYFSQVTCFLTWNVCNYAGTVLAGLIKRPTGRGRSSQVLLLFAAVARIAFVPLFMMCNLAPNNRSNPVRITSDVGFVAIMAVFSLSDGYIMNMCLMFGPKAVESGLQEKAAAVLIAVTSSSISVGTMLSNLVVKAL